MRAAWQILNKVMVKQFYLQNAGLFLFAFLFLFGIVDAGHLVSYHLSLMYSMISLPLFLFIVMLLWMLYNIRCIAFCSAAVQAADGSFLYRLRGLSITVQLVLYLVVSASLYLPVFVYACVLAKVALPIKSIVSWQVMFWQLMMICMGAASLFIVINKTSESFITRVTAAVGKTFRVNIGYPAFLLAYILHERKAALAIVKIFSLLMLGMLMVRNADGFDADLFAIFYPLTVVAHATLVLQCVSFNETLLHTNRNLPLHWLKVAAMYGFTWLMILLPETAFMFINNHGNLPLLQIAMESLTAVLMLFLFTGMALGCGLDNERYLLFVFMSYIVMLILQKSIGHVAAAGALAALSVMVFGSHYYSFERERVK